MTRAPSGSDVLEFHVIVPTLGHTQDSNTHGIVPRVRTAFPVNEYHFITRTNHYYCRVEGQWGPRIIETILPRAISSCTKTSISPPGQLSLQKSAFNYQSALTKCTIAVLSHLRNMST